MLAGDFGKAGVKVVGVSRDPMKKHEKFIGKYDLSVPLVSDEDGTISDAFGTWVESRCTAANIWAWSAPPT